MKKHFLVALVVFQGSLWAQNTFNFDGQLSGVANWAPESEAWGLLNVRYLPELNAEGLGVLPAFNTALF